MMRDYSIRNAGPEDWSAITDICVRTADKGQDGRRCFSDHEYPGLLWALPYLAVEPEQAFVLTHSTDVVGYAVGTVDTKVFAQKLEDKWWQPVRERISKARAVTPDDHYVFGYIAQPETMPAEIVARYPAHLHVNRLPQAQGHGRGTRLLETLLGSLAAGGATGVYLGVNHLNEPVAAFYRKLGFAEIARLPSIIMAKRL